MTVYRIRKMVDLKIEPSDGLFNAPSIMGTFDNIPTEHELRRAGWDVQKITSPDEDPPGTVRRFVESGDHAIKDQAGVWRYLYPASGRASVSELVEFETEVVELT